MVDISPRAEARKLPRSSYSNPKKSRLFDASVGSAGERGGVEVLDFSNILSSTFACKFANQ